MPDIDQLLDHLSQQLAVLKSTDLDTRSLSRFAGQGASRSFVESLSTTTPTAVRSPVRQDIETGGIAAFLSKALAEGTGTAGGYLVPVQLAAEVLTMLRARSAVMRMGPTVVPVEKELDINSLSTGASASYVAENARIPVSEQTFAQSVLLRPKDLTALVPISNRLLKDAASNPSIEQVIRSDLAEVMALRADLAFLRGTGVGAEPTGVRNSTGLTPAPSLGTNGATPTYDHFKDLVAAIRTQNALFERPGWIFHPRLLNTLEKLKDANGRYLAETELLTFDATGGGGTLLGYPFRTTTQIPVNITTGSSNDTTEVYFSTDWQECWIGEEQELVIEVSAEASYSVDGTTWNSAWQQQQHLFRSVWRHDVGLRRPQLFSVMTGVRQ
jgi:HK97 family phage major capsid protein